MAPLKSELWAQLSYLVDLLDEHWKWTASNSPNYLSLEDTIVQALEGVHSADVLNILAQIRSEQNNILSAGESLLLPVIQEIGRIGYNSVQGEIGGILSDIRKGMDSASETVKERGWSHGSVAAPTGTGNGKIYRLTEDQYGDEIESGHINGYTVKIECQSDKNNGLVAGQEQFAIYGVGEVPIDLLEGGEVPDNVVEIFSTRAADGLLVNPSFDDLNDTLTTDESGWTLSSASASVFEKNETTFYRYTPGSFSEGVSLEAKDNGSITQYLNEEGVQIDTSFPVFLILRYLKKDSCDGTLTLRLGSQTQFVDLATKSNDIWYNLAIPRTSVCWYDNFKEDSLDKGVRVQISLSSNTTGSVIYDEIIMAQPVFWDGKYYLITAGDTDFLKGDYSTVTDTVSNTGRIQYWISRLFGTYFPHTSGTPTYADA